MVATERGVSRSALTELLRHAVDELALPYEEVAFASLGQILREQAHARLAGQRQRA